MALSAENTRFRPCVPPRGEWFPRFIGHFGSGSIAAIADSPFLLTEPVIAGDTQIPCSSGSGPSDALRGQTCAS